MNGKTFWGTVLMAALLVVGGGSDCGGDEELSFPDAAAPLPGEPEDCEPACVNLYDCGYCTVMAESFCYVLAQCIDNCQAEPPGAQCIRDVDECEAAAFQQCGWNVAERSGG